MLTKDQMRHILTTMHYATPDVRQAHDSDVVILVWNGEIRNGSRNHLERLCDGLKEHCFARLQPHGYKLVEAKIVTGEPSPYPHIQWTITFKVSPC